MTAETSELCELWHGDTSYCCRVVVPKLSAGHGYWCLSWEVCMVGTLSIQDSSRIMRYATVLLPTSTPLQSMIHNHSTLLNCYCWQLLKPLDYGVIKLPTYTVLDTTSTHVCKLFSQLFSKYFLDAKTNNCLFLI